MVALIKGSPYVAISAGQVSNRPTPSPFCPRLKIERTNERTNDVKADAGCSTLFRVSLSRQRRSGPVAMLELSRLFELAGGTRGMTDRPFDLERALPPSPRFLSGCTLLSLSISISPSLSTPFTELIGKSIGGDGRRKNKSEEGAKEKRSPARIRQFSRSLRSSPYFPSLSPLVKWNDTCTTTDPIVLCPLPLPPARSLPRKRGFEAIVRVLASLSALNRFPIVLCLLSCCASARSPPSFLSCKIHKTQILPPKKERKKLSNTIKGISRRKGEEKQKNFSSL